MSLLQGTCNYVHFCGQEVLYVDRSDIMVSKYLSVELCAYSQSGKTPCIVELSKNLFILHIYIICIYVYAYTHSDSLNDCRCPYFRVHVIMCIFVDRKSRT